MIPYARQLSRAALPVCLAAMDTCWIYMALWLFERVVLDRLRPAPLPSPLVLMLLELAAWGLSVLLLDRTPLPVAVAQVVTGAVGLAAAFALVALGNYPTQSGFTWAWLAYVLYALLVSLGFWALGLFRASRLSAFNEVFRDFQIGLLVTALGALLSWLATGVRVGELWAGLGALPLWFFAWGLTAVALGNREALREEVGSSAAGSWAGMLALSIGGVLLVGLAAGAFGGRGLLEVLGQVALAVLVLAELVVYWALSIVLTLWAELLKLLPQRSPGPPPNTAQPTPEPAGPPSLPMPPPGRYRLNPSVTIPQELITIGTWLLMIAAVVLVIWLISRVLRRTRLGRQGRVSEERERLGSWSLFARQLKAWLARLMGRFRRPSPVRATVVQDDLASLSGGPEWSGTLSVRRIYARMQGLAGRAGYPRKPQQTPIEYLTVLSDAMPDLMPEFRAITAAYLEARYGPVPASAPAVQAATEAWGRAEPALRARLTG